MFRLKHLKHSYFQASTLSPFFNSQIPIITPHPLSPPESAV